MANWVSQLHFRLIICTINLKYLWTLKKDLLIKLFFYYLFLFISCKIKNLQQDLNIVWIKRDIRTQDHEPLYYAEKSKLNYLIIYIFEPSILKHKDYSIRHLQFIYHSILDVNLKLKNFNKEIIIFNNEAQSVFKFLIENFSIKNNF